MLGTPPKKKKLVVALGTADEASAATFYFLQCGYIFVQYGYILFTLQRLHFVYFTAVAFCLLYSMDSRVDAVRTAMEAARLLAQGLPPVDPSRLLT